MSKFWPFKIRQGNQANNEIVSPARDDNAQSITQTEGNELSAFQFFLFGIGILLTFIILYFSVSGVREVHLASNWIYALLILNFFVISYFAIGIWQRFAHLLKADRSELTGAKLHVHYVRLFVFAAAFPAILIALFSALTIGRGVQAWLSGQVRDTITSTQAFGKEMVKQITNAAESDIVAMATDLNAAASQFNAAPNEYQTYLANQSSRRGFVATYIFDGNGNVLAKATRPQSVPRLIAPDNDNLATARAGAIAINIDDSLTVRAFYRLSGYENAYLQTVRLPNPEQQKLVRQAYQVVTAYQTLEKRLAQIQLIFALAYLETVLLVVVGAAWLGLASASRISVPIAQLARAAEKVRGGDLSVRIVPDTRVEELSSLTNTFNRMTIDLMQQQDALKSATEQAEQRTVFIQTVFEGVSAGIVSLKASDEILTANGAAARLLGVEYNELLNRGLFNIAPAFKQITANAKNGALAQGQVEQGQVEMDINNETLIFDIRASYVGNDLVVTFDEISSVLIAQKQAAWKDVARRIAHEIRNPLTPIHLSAERLARKFSKQIHEDKDTFLRMTDTIVRQVSDIGRMVDEFSSFARMPSPKFEADNIAEIIREAVFAQKIASPEIEFVFHCPPEAIMVSMDSRLIAQAIGNILKNAAESIAQVPQDNSRLPHSVTVEMDIDGEFARIDICDTGIGFPKQGRQKLLEPYMTTRAKGTGLGLAIVARVIEEHGGLLKLDDRPDGEVGACVGISLPIITGTIKLQNKLLEAKNGN